MPKLVATSPAPASAPAHSAVSSAGAGPSQYAKHAAAISENTKLTPNTLAGWPGGFSPPLSALQAFPNNTLEYQRPPSRKLETAATSTARWFMACSGSQLDVVGDPRRARGDLVVGTARAIVVLGGDPADDRPVPGPADLDQRGDQLFADFVAARRLRHEQIVEETAH